MLQCLVNSLYLLYESLYFTIINDRSAECTPADCHIKCSKIDIYYYYFFIRLSVIFFQQFQEVISSFLESIVGMKTLIVSLITILSQVICLFSLVTFNITQF